ncbi:MAG: hypothetical protein ACI855_003975, partial [Myxococcota bacterium]
RLRVALDSTFIIRTDIGLRAKEDRAPSEYIEVRKLF